MLRAPFLAAAAAAACASLATAQSFDYPDFTDLTGLVLLGSAAPSGNFLQITPNLASQTGAVWYDTPVLVGGGFETTFRFRITLPGAGGADGMTLVLQNDPRGTTAIGEGGGELGYGATAAAPAGTAIANSLVIEVDTWFNGADLSDNEVSIHTNGTGDNSADEIVSLGQATPADNMSNGGFHTVRVRYVPGTLEVYVNDLATPLLSVPYDFATGGTHIGGGAVGGLDLIGGDSLYVGFTASTGGAWENHNLISWEWNSGNQILAYCFGDGSGTPCPCGNEAPGGGGCQNSSGAGGLLAAAGTTSVGADDLAFAASHLLPGQPALLFAGLNAVNGGDGVLFGDGLRCAGGSVVRLGVRVPDSNGDASWGPGLAAIGGWVAGDTRTFQGWYRDPSPNAPCGTGFNLTNGVQVAFEP